MTDPHPHPASKAKPVVVVEFTQEELNALGMAVTAYITRRYHNLDVTRVLRNLEQRIFDAHKLFGPLPGLSLRPHPRPRPAITNREGMKARMQEEIAEEEKEEEKE